MELNDEIEWARDEKLARIEFVRGGLHDVGRRVRFASRDMVRARIVSAHNCGECIAQAFTLREVLATLERAHVRVVGTVGNLPKLTLD